MTIREANSGDATDLARLTAELGYTGSEDLMRRRLARIASQPDGVVLVAILDEKIAGWLQAHASVSLESGYVAEVAGLIVAASARRRGVGRALVENAERWASELGVEALLVRSNVQRAESHDFYRALGFISVKTQAVYRKTP
jgi:N-acetylglutamate synthase-like GNAT family acetyltransferase